MPLTKGLAGSKSGRKEMLSGGPENDHVHEHYTEPAHSAPLLLLRGRGITHIISSPSS